MVEDDLQDKILYRELKSLKLGDTNRFKVHYTPQCLSSSIDEDEVKIPSSLWVKIRNIEPLALRAAYIAGPYVLYVDCRPDAYDIHKNCFVTADQPVFEPQLLPGQSFYAQLNCHTVQDEYCWTIDVMSQIIFSHSMSVDYEITVGTSRSILHDASIPDKKVANSDKQGTFVPTTYLNVMFQDTLDLWNLPVPDPNKEIHLVILTHGLHSNISGDMFYLKEQIDRASEGQNVVVKGYFGNIGKTERGIKYLGSRVAEYIIDLVTNNETLKGKVKKISFIGHSLGGLVQTFAIAYLQSNFPWFFSHIEPINFITLASPLLGVVHENPLYVKLALLAGIVGQTGRDLGLKFVEQDDKPLLLLLPTGPTHQVLRKFHRRTVYANLINDAIVPLRTSALLYLDYKGLSQVMSSSNLDDKKEQNDHTIPSNVSESGTGNEDWALLLSVQAVMSYFMPQKQASSDRKSAVTNSALNRFQTSALETEDPLKDNDIIRDLPKSSVFQIVSSLILPPSPSIKYITDPSSRENVVIHDKVYSEEDLPPLKEPKRSSTSKLESLSIGQKLNIHKRLLETIDYKIEHLEEAIAREYHKKMTWRKVLLRLNIDAHNNIIVRRRFSNAHGWPVIDHLVENHFSEAYSAKEASKNSHIESPNNEEEEGLLKILSRDRIAEQNKEIDEGIETTDHAWVNSKEDKFYFKVGPSGFLNNLSDVVLNLKDQWTNYGVKAVTEETEQEPALQNEPVEPKQIESAEGDLGLKTSVMGGFM